MANLTKLNWPGGYYPSQDAINGNPATLLRADNLQQEQDGALGLVRSNKLIKSFADVISNFYSKTYAGVDYLYVGVGSCQSVKEVLLDGSQRFSGDILSGAQGRPVFGDAYGLVLACAGTQRKKFDGQTVYKLGLETPLIPIRSKNPATNAVESFIQNAAEAEIVPAAQGGAAWSLDEGTGLTQTNHSAQFFPDPVTNRAVLSCAFTPKIDVLNIAGEQSTNPGNDTFFMDVQLDDPNAFSSIRVQLNLDDDGKNYFWYEWVVPGSTEFSLSKDAWSKISASRSQFNRQGSDVTLDWKTIKSIQITVNSVVSTAFVGIDTPRFIGGIQGQLLGSYQYIYRWVKDMGTYLAKSPFSPISEVFTAINGSVFVLPHPPTDQSAAGGLQFCTVEIFRRSVPSTESYFNSLTGQFSQLPDILDQFYLVSQGTDPAGYVQDTIGDVEVLKLDTPANTFLDSVQNIPESIVDIVGVYNDRVLYLTSTSLYLSERLNPDAFDIRYTLKFTGDPFDNNFWIKSLSNATLIMGSNHDLYEISGTLLDLPDGTLDINVYAFGDAYPPLSVDVAKIDGLLFYVAADGVRTTSGSNSSLLSPHLSQLFQGIDCHGVPAVLIYANGVERYYITVAKGKLYVSLPHTDGLYRLHVYDLIKKIWTIRVTTGFVTGCWATATDKVVFANGPIAVLAESGNSYSNATAQSINLLTVYDHDGTPRNRKDTETLKLVIDTGGANLDVYLGVMKASGTQMNFVQTINTNGLQTVYIKLKDSSLTLGFRYALQLVGAALTRFKLVEYTIEYLPRPEQINYIRIPNSNLGSTGRKRFISIPFVIDCLAATVKCTPIIDNIAGTSTANFTSIDQKETKNFFFTSESVGTDLGFILESLNDSPFELTGPEYEKAVSEMMPAPAEFLLLPPNDFGTPNRKRATSIKFELNTRGADVTFTPRVDQTDYPSMVCNSGEDKKKIFEYFFSTNLGDFTWFLLGGTFSGSSPFELYDGLVPQQLEVFPPRLESLYLAETNYGAASRKRIRTLPIIINTNGHDVTYRPYVDGVAYPPTILNSTKKATLYHFFATDSFGIDYAGFLSGQNPFEFYEMAAPLGVEVLPVPRKFDQLGPLRFDKIGKLFALRLRVVLVGTTKNIPFSIYGDNQEMDPTYDGTPQYSGVFPITPGEDVVVQANLPKSVNSTIFRVTLGPCADAFHRYDLQAKVQQSGMESDAKWVPIR